MDRFHVPGEKLGYHQRYQDHRKLLIEHHEHLDCTFLDSFGNRVYFWNHNTIQRKKSDRLEFEKQQLLRTDEHMHFSVVMGVETEIYLHHMEYDHLNTI
jgi:hypothetical protein